MGSESMSRYGAYAIIIQDDKVLLTEKKTGPYQGLWDLPGGGIEFGETPEVTVRREIEEEAALKATGVDLKTVFTYHGNFLKGRTDNIIHHIGIIYRVDRVVAIPDRIPEEKIRWLPISEVDSEELTPFAKQAWFYHFFRQGQ